MLTRPHRNLHLATVQAAVANLVHDLSQPVAALSLLVETAGMSAQRTAASDKIAGALQDAEDQVDRLVGLLRTVSQTARDAVLEPPPNGATIRSLVTAAVEASGVERIDAVRVLVDVPDAPFPLAAEIEVITLALLQNCVEAPAAGEVRIGVSLTGAEHLELIVSNDGPMPASLDSLCEPFFTTKSHHLGLGLSLCRRMAVVHGGDLRLEALPEGGLRVRVEMRAPGD